MSISDRCDRCNAPAQTTAILPSSHILALCGHHANQHQGALIAAGAVMESAA